MGLSFALRIATESLGARCMSLAAAWHETADEPAELSFMSLVIKRFSSFLAVGISVDNIIAVC